MFSESVKNGNGVIKSFKDTVGAATIGVNWLAVGIGAAITAISLINNAIKENSRKIEENAQKTGEALNKVKSDMNELDGLIKQYNDLQMSNEWDNTPVETKKQLHEDINKLLGDEADKVDILNGKYKETTEELFKQRMSKLSNGEEAKLAFDNEQAKGKSLWDTAYWNGGGGAGGYNYGTMQATEAEKKFIEKYEKIFDEKYYSAGGGMGGTDYVVRFDNFDDLMTKYEEAKKMLQEMYNEGMGESELYKGLNAFIAKFDTKVSEYKTAVEELENTKAGQKLANYINTSVGGYIDNLDEYKTVVDWIQSNFTGKDADNALGLLNSYFSEYAEKVSKTNEMLGQEGLSIQLENLKSASEGIATISKAFKELSEDGYITIDTLSEIQEKTGLSGSAWEAYYKKLLNVKKGSKEADEVFADLTFQMLDSKFKIDGVVDATEDEIAAVLRENSVLNANEVARSYLAQTISSEEKEKAKLHAQNIDLEKSSEDLTDDINSEEVKHDDLSDSVDSEKKEKASLESQNIDLEESSEDLAKELNDEATACGITKNAFVDLVAQEKIFNNDSLSVEDKISALQKLWSAAFLAKNEIEGLQKLQIGWSTTGGDESYFYVYKGKRYFPGTEEYNNLPSIIWADLMNSTTNKPKTKPEYDPDDDDDDDDDEPKYSDLYDEGLEDEQEKRKPYSKNSETYGEKLADAVDVGNDTDIKTYSELLSDNASGAIAFLKTQQNDLLWEYEQMIMPEIWKLAPYLDGKKWDEITEQDKAAVLDKMPDGYNKDKLESLWKTAGDYWTDIYETIPDLIKDYEKEINDGVDSSVRGIRTYYGNLDKSNQRLLDTAIDGGNVDDIIEAFGQVVSNETLNQKDISDSLKKGNLSKSTKQYLNDEMNDSKDNISQTTKTAVDAIQSIYDEKYDAAIEELGDAIISGDTSKVKAVKTKIEGFGSNRQTKLGELYNVEGLSENDKKFIQDEMDTSKKEDASYKTDYVRGIVGIYDDDADDSKKAYDEALKNGSATDMETAYGAYRTTRTNEKTEINKLLEDPNLSAEDKKFLEDRRDEIDEEFGGSWLSHHIDGINDYYGGLYSDEQDAYNRAVADGNMDEAERIKSKMDTIASDWKGALEPLKNTENITDYNKKLIEDSILDIGDKNKTTEVGNVENRLKFYDDENTRLQGLLQTAIKNGDASEIERLTSAIIENNDRKRDYIVGMLKDTSLSPETKKILEDAQTDAENNEDDTIEKSISGILDAYNQTDSTTSKLFQDAIRDGDIQAVNEFFATLNTNSQNVQDYIKEKLNDENLPPSVRTMLIEALAAWESKDTDNYESWFNAHKDGYLKTDEEFARRLGEAVKRGDVGLVQNIASERVANQQLYQDWLRSIFDDENTPLHIKNEIKAYLDESDEIITGTMDSVNESINNCFSEYKRHIDRTTRALQEQADAYDILINKGQALVDAEQRMYEAQANVRQIQRDITKELRTNKAMAEYLDESTRNLLFNEDDYVTLDKKLRGISSDIAGINSWYNNQINALTEENWYLEEAITKEYERRLAMKEKEYEIARAELDLEKKKQELNNILNEKNIRMLVRGVDGSYSWQYVHNVEEASRVIGEISDLESEISEHRLQTEQQSILNKKQADVDNLSAEKAAHENHIKLINEETEELALAIENITNPLLDFGAVMKSLTLSLNGGKSFTGLIQPVDESKASVDESSESFVSSTEGMTTSTDNAAASLDNFSSSLSYDDDMPIKLGSNTKTKTKGSNSFTWGKEGSGRQDASIPMGSNWGESLSIAERIGAEARQQYDEYIASGGGTNTAHAKDLQAVIESADKRADRIKNKFENAVQMVYEDDINSGYTFDHGGLAKGKGLLFKDIDADELVLDPKQTDIFSQYVSQMSNWGDTLDNISRIVYPPTPISKAETAKNESFNFYGNLEFPNVQNADDFIKELTSRAKSKIYKHK